MANEKNKINELVSDEEDTTSELELITFRGGPFAGDEELEADADTCGFPDNNRAPEQSDAATHELQAELASKNETIGRLQFDMEQLRSRERGLEADTRAREEIIAALTRETEALKDSISKKDDQLRERDTAVRSLKREIRARDAAHRSLSQKFEDLEHRLDREPPPTPGPQTDDAVYEEVKARLARSEEYADSLRHKLHDLLETQEALSSDREYLTALVEQESQSIGEKHLELEAAAKLAEDLRGQLDAQRIEHEREIRMLRFELGQAQDTVSETTALNEQLASDLVDTRGFKDELEHMLNDSEERAQERIFKLEERLAELSLAAEEYENKLASKTAAINVLLGELTKKTGSPETAGQPDGDTHDVEYPDPGGIEVLYEEHAESPSPALAERGKVSRVLIGKVGDQILRFPLFKRRLTIGRTSDNDIQLKPSYISRRHAVILTEGDAARVIDWGSKNGVFVNAKKVTEHFLANGDILAVGNAKFRYEERPKHES